MLKTTGLIFFHQICTFVVFKISPFIMYAFTSLTTVAYYGNYLVVIDKAKDILGMAFSSTGNGIGNLIASGDLKHSLDVFWELIDSRLCISFGCIFVIGVITEPLISVWLSGNLIVIFLAGLQNVPRSYLEAAEVDGANSWQRFWNITIPVMSPIIFYNLLMALITNLQVITPALALTKGGPGSSSRFVSYVMYQYAFENRKFGYAAAVSVMLFILIGIFTVILFATSKSWMFQQGGDRDE